MRVLVVTTWFPTRTAPGSGAFVARDVAALAQDHDVRVLHLVAPGVDDGERSLVHDGVPVERVPMAPHRPDQVLAAAREVRARAGAADLVHTVAISSLLPLARWRPDRPWVHTEHWSGLLAPETLPPAVRVARPLAARLLRRPDVVTVVSEHLAPGIGPGAGSGSGTRGVGDGRGAEAVSAAASACPLCPSAGCGTWMCAVGASTPVGSGSCCAVPSVSVAADPFVPEVSPGWAGASAPPCWPFACCGIAACSPVATRPRPSDSSGVLVVSFTR